MNEQIRKDLDIADRVVRACWGNFVATEPTYVLRDLIVIEIQKARDAEREACAVKCREYAENYPPCEAVGQLANVATPRRHTEHKDKGPNDE